MRTGRWATHNRSLNVLSNVSRSNQGSAEAEERAELEARLRAGTTKQRQLLRIRIVLEAAMRSSTREIARELETTPPALRGVDVQYVRRALHKQMIDLAGRKSWCESTDPESLPSKPLMWWTSSGAA